MSLPSPFLINSFSSFLLITYQVLCMVKILYGLGGRGGGWLRG